MIEAVTQKLPDEFPSYEEEPTLEEVIAHFRLINKRLEEYGDTHYAYVVQQGEQGNLEILAKELADEREHYQYILEGTRDVETEEATLPNFATVRRDRAMITAALAEIKSPEVRTWLEELQGRIPGTKLYLLFGQDSATAQRRLNRIEAYQAFIGTLLPPTI